MKEEIQAGALVPLEVERHVALLPKADEFRAMLEVASQFAQVAGQLIPKDLNTPAKVFAVMELGRELGIPPMAAFNHVYIVNGRAQPDAQLQMGLVKSRDRTAEFIFHKQTAEACDAELKRGGKSVVRITYTIEDAQRSGQMRRVPGGPWEKYPLDMLTWATVKRLCKLGAPDIVNAIGAYGAPAGEVVDVEVVDVSREAAAESLESTEEPCLHLAAKEYNDPACKECGEVLMQGDGATVVEEVESATTPATTPATATAPFVGHFNDVGKLLTWAVKEMGFKGSDDVYGVLSVESAEDIVRMGLDVAERKLWEISEARKAGAASS
jgi:hypothetical protein